MSGLLKIAPRLAFNGKVNLLEAYAWSRPEMFKFLVKVAETPLDYGVVKGSEKSVIDCVDLITKFDYNNTDRLRIFTKPGAGTKKILDEKVFLWNGIATPFFSPFDCLGFVYSMMGTADSDASKENYFAPLVSVFGKHLNTLAGDPAMAPNRAFIAYQKVPYNPAPVMLSIDLPENTASPPTALDIAIGANIGAAGDCKAMIQQQKWVWMSQDVRLNLGLSPDLSIIRTTLKGRGQLFGHCAETIPLIVFLGTRDLSMVNTVAGICINVNSIGQVATYDQQSIIKCLVDPCPNCQEIIRQYRADPANFQKEVLEIIKAIVKH